MTVLPTAVALDLLYLGAVDGHMASLATLVALDLRAVFLNVTIFTTSVALLLFWIVTVTSKMASSATSVTAQFPHVFRLDTVFSDVTTFPTVVANVLEKVTVLGMMTRLTAAVTEVSQCGGTALRTSAMASSSAPSSLSSSTAPPGPGARASTAEVFLTAHGCSEIF